MFHCLNVNKFAHPFTYERESCLLEAELIFVKSVKSMSRIFFFHLDIQLFQHHLLKRLSLLQCIAFAAAALSEMS